MLFRSVTVNSLGTIVGVSSAGNPIVEWEANDYFSYAPEELIVVEMPTPNEELDPESDGSQEAERLAKLREERGYNL